MRNAVLFALSLVLCPLAAIAFVARPSLLAVVAIALGLAIAAGDAAIPWLAYPTTVAGLVALLVETSAPPSPRKPLGVGP